MKRPLVLLIGTNMGNRTKHLQTAEKMLTETFGALVAYSGVYATAAWGKTDQNDFLNQALVYETDWTAEKCLQKALSVENEMGRIRTERWGPRVIDIDLIFLGQEVQDSKHLTLPHPRMHLRRFVLCPLSEILPDFEHPILKKTLKNLLLNCEDPSEVRLEENP